MGWAVGTNDMDAFVARTDAAVIVGSIEMDDGSIGSWQIADPLDDRNGALPFVIQYDGDGEARRQGQTDRFAEADHPCGAQVIAWVEVSCEARHLNEWLDDDELPIRVVHGPPGLRRVGLEAAEGREIVLE